MSGGSMNYLYRKLLWEADFEDKTELRKEFRMHLVVVAAALKAIEWVDSGDMSPGDEDEAIAVVLGSTRCICGEMPKYKCPGEWEPGCDLGNNPKYAKRVDRPQRMRDSGYTRRPTLREMSEPEMTNQCGETCERAKLCATCARGLEEPKQAHDWREDGVATHNGEYWYKCARCGLSDWIASYGTLDQLMPRECKPVTALRRPEQEPVAWMCDNENLVAKGYSRFSKDKDGAWNIPVYTNPSRHEAELLNALKDAADAIEHWGAYVPDYFQSKHDLKADIDRARDTIAKVEGNHD
jgi:hypothetical protein